MLPVLTKVDQKKFKNIQLDNIKLSLFEILKKELAVQIIENEELADNQDEQNKLMNFYRSFANKLVIYDPLDRPIPKEGENQALKQTDFVDTLNK